MDRQLSARRAMAAALSWTSNVCSGAETILWPDGSDVNRVAGQPICWHARLANIARFVFLFIPEFNRLDHGCKEV